MSTFMQFQGRLGFRAGRSNHETRTSVLLISFFSGEGLTAMRNRNTLFRAEQSRAEQSRAEQSRAEQSRAEQSRAEQSRVRVTLPFFGLELNILTMDNRRILSGYYALAGPAVLSCSETKKRPAKGAFKGANRAFGRGWYPPRGGAPA